jgi:ferredoxin
MRVVIDESRCSGHGRCYDVAPSLFTDDDRGYGQVIGDGNCDAHRAAAAAAISVCPERAISVVD